MATQGLFLIEDFPREEPLLGWVAEKYGSPRLQDDQPIVCPICDRPNCTAPAPEEQDNGQPTVEEGHTTDCTGDDCEDHRCHGPVAFRSGIVV